MNPKTKDRVEIAWKIQRALRALALLGALAAVFCVISLRNVSTGTAWIIRAGPCVALCHTLYAIYFFCGSTTSRPPTSVASYQMFAALLDTGLVPFFTFACYMASMDYTQNTYGWGTLFNDNDIDYKIIEVFMIVTGVENLFLILSLVTDIYLTIMYRKVAKLPPDMNPLEEKDNLTARPRHKRNKSELVYAKHLSDSTLASQRLSQLSDIPDPSRRVPYKHTRTDSADRDSFSFQRDFVNEFKDPYSARASMSIDRNGNQVSRPTSAVVPPANARPAGAGLEFKPARSSGLARTSTITRPTSWLSYADYEGTSADVYDYANHEYDYQGRALSPVSAISEDQSNYHHHAPRQQQQYRPETPPEQNLRQQNQENTMPKPDQIGLAVPCDLTPPRKRSRDPLGMNPPTPVHQEFTEEELMVKPLRPSVHHTPQKQALREVDTNSVAYGTPLSRPASFVGSGNKSKFYGDLRNSMSGSPTRGAQTNFVDDNLRRSDTTKSAESGNFEVYGSESEDEYHPHREDHGKAEVVRELTPGQQWNGSRQISNSTGYDLHNAYAGLDAEFGKGMARRREVSGKVAEEGRGHEVMVEVSALTSKPGAAGWARFKGL